jgi:hypothetical protein
MGKSSSCPAPVSFFAFYNVEILDAWEYNALQKKLSREGGKEL